MKARGLGQVWARLALLLVAGALVGSVPAALAQGVAGTILGSIADETGAALPGVAVVIKNVETGTTRTLTSDESGRYRAPGLQPGAYEVTAELSGFQTSVRSGLQVALGQEMVVNHVLAIGQLTEQVVVSGAASLVETTSSTVAQLVDQRQMRELPLNGRDFSELALTTVGVTQSPTTDRSLLRGMGTQFSVAGARPNQVSYLLDGTDIADQGGQSPGSAAGGMLGIDAVREFQVITNNYSAEYGRSAGGIVSAITRSGTNDIQGGAFLFIRNDALDSRTYFDDPSEPKPPLTRNQYGFNVGGPLKQNKTFFFGAYEGLRQDKSRTVVARVPSMATRNRSDLAANSRPYLLLYPLPNGPVSGQSALYSETVMEPSRENYFVIKVDHTLSDKDSMSVRYTFDQASVTEFLPIPIFSNAHSNRNQFVTFEWKRLFSGSLFNDFRAAFNRTYQQSLTVDNVGVDESLFFIPGTQFGTITVTGLDQLGADTAVPYMVGYNVIQALDSLTWTKGNHTLKSGFAFTRWVNDQNATFQLGGRYQFSSIDNFVLGRSGNFESALPGTGADRYWRQNMFAVYAQDDWALKSSLTMNLGLRYEFITSPKEKYDRVASFRNPPYDPAPTVGYPLFKNPSLKNVSPRVGMAWDVTGDGRTAIRGGTGIFFEPILANIYRTFGNRTPPYFYQASLTNPPFPTAVAGQVPTSSQRLDLLEFDLDNPYVWQFNVTMQREIMPNFSVTVGYVGSRGYELFRTVEANQSTPVIQPDGSYFFPVGSARRSPLWAAVRIRRTDGRSWYNGFIASATKRFSGGLQFQGSYTLGRATDYGSIAAGSQDFNNGTPPRYADDPEDSFGAADYNVKHNFTFNYSWMLPFGEGMTGAAKALASGWQVSGIVTLRSGVPFTPLIGAFDRARARPRSGGDGQTPDWAPGFDESNVVTGTPEQYFDPNAFVLPAAGTFGNVPRNPMTGPGYAVWNMAVFKNFEFGDRRRLQIRIETFNVLNRANFALPSYVIFADATGRVAENAGEITDIVGTARQIQIGAKFEF